jgi:hypothetical protein
LSDYLPEALVTRYATHLDNKPVIDAAVTLPYADKSFDGCVITDVYEHVHAEVRPRLLSEMLRVTDGIVLVGAPHGDEIVTRFDRIVFDFIWGKYAERFEPLDQHMTFGLEPLDQTLQSLRSMGAGSVVALPCNYVYRWIHQILIFFDIGYRSAFSDLFEPLNRVYNERISPYDYREPCYRYLIAVATNPLVHVDALVDQLNSPATPAYVASTEGVLLETYRAIEATLSDKLKTAAQEIERLNSIIEQLQADNEFALNEIKYLRFSSEQITEVSTAAVAPGSSASRRNAPQSLRDRLRRLMNKRG